MDRENVLAVTILRPARQHVISRALIVSRGKAPLADEIYRLGSATCVLPPIFCGALPHASREGDDSNIFRQ
jgi:hypothetical protein